MITWKTATFKYSPYYQQRKQHLLRSERQHENSTRSVSVQQILWSSITKSNAQVVRLHENISILMWLVVETADCKTIVLKQWLNHIGAADNIWMSGGWVNYAKSAAGHVDKSSYRIHNATPRLTWPLTGYYVTWAGLGARAIDMIYRAGLYYCVGTANWVTLPYTHP